MVFDRDAVFNGEDDCIITPRNKRSMSNLAGTEYKQEGVTFYHQHIAPRQLSGTPKRKKKKNPKK